MSGGLKEVAMAIIWLVMFWNVENFFTPVQDGVNDGEYTPTGWRGWSWRKFNKKRDDIAKIILLAKEQYGKYPMLIGLCEIENRKVLNELVYNTMLSRAGYAIVHRDSPDSRGIDVALLYREEEFKIIHTQFLSIPDLKNGGVLNTREILYVKGVAAELDTLHCFVNHWPSRLGGDKKSYYKRLAAKQILEAKCDSLLTLDSLTNIIAMGDFNAGPAAELLKFKGLKNMSLEQNNKNGSLGTYKYRGTWESIDHFFISESLYNGRWFYAKDGADIFAPEYLLEEDPSYFGNKIKRTMVGPRYSGGVSDHLPIILKIFQEEY